MAEYKCHTCCKVDPPRPLPNELPGTTLWSTCDHCGPAYHHINCLPQEYRAAATARAIENPSEDSLSQDNEPPLTCKCYRCLDRLSQDPFNLKQTDQQVISECWAAAGNALKSARKTLDRLQAPAAPATPAAAALPATPATPAAAALPATPANRNRSRTTAKKKGKDSGSMVMLKSLGKNLDMKAQAYDQPTPQVAVLFGLSKVGKSACLDSVCRLCPDQMCPSARANADDATAGHLPHFLTKAEAATLKHFSTYKGAPMQLDFCHHFQQNGELQDRVALKKDADTQLHHQNAFLHSQLLRSEDIVSAALPVYRRHQRSPITTKQATGFHKNTRHSCIILLVDSTILFNLTQLAINSDDDRDKTLLSVYKVDEAGQPVLPESKEEVERRLSPEIQAFFKQHGGRLGAPIIIKQPNKHTASDKVFLQGLLSALSCQGSPDTPSPVVQWPWLTHLVIAIFRGVPSMLLTDPDWVLDPPGNDGSALQSLRRGWAMNFATAIVLVVDRDVLTNVSMIVDVHTPDNKHLLFQAHPLDLLKAEGLLQQIANDKLALCIIQCNKDPLTAQDVCDDAILAAMAQQAADNEQNNRKGLRRALLALPNRDKADAVLAKVPAATYNAHSTIAMFGMLRNGIVIAQAVGLQLSQQDEDALMERCLVSTGVGDFFRCLTGVLRDNSYRAAKELEQACKALAGMATFLRQDIAQPADSEAFEHLLQSFHQAFLTQKHTVRAMEEYIEGFVPSASVAGNAVGVPLAAAEDQPIPQVVKKLEELWFPAQARAEAAARNKSAGIPGGKLDNNHKRKDFLLKLEHYEQVLEPRDSTARRGGRRSQALDTAVVAPLLEWVNDIPQDTIQKLLQPVQQYLAVELTKCGQGVLGFPSCPAAAQLLQLWTEHIVPVVAMQLIDTDHFWEQIKASLWHAMHRQIQEKLTALKDTVLKRKAEVEETSCGELLENRIIRDSFDAVALLTGFHRKDSAYAGILGTMFQEAVVPAWNALVPNGGLITRMRMDSQILQNADGRADLAQLLDYVTGPVAEIANTLQISTCEGAHKMERLMVMIHRHSDLLPKFQGELARRWHTYKEECSNQFSSLAAPDIIVRPSTTMSPKELMTRWYESIPVEAQADAECNKGFRVDLEGLCTELTSMVVGFEGRVAAPNAAGGTVPLDLTSQGEQCQAVSELLVQRLLKVAISELFELKDNDWLSQTAGKDSANTMLTECSYKSSPWHALLLVALLTGNHIQVKIPSHAATATGRARGKRRKVDAAVQKKGYILVQINPPKQRPGNRAHAMLTQCLLKRDLENKSWTFEVLSSRRATVDGNHIYPAAVQGGSYKCGEQAGRVSCDGLHCVMNAKITELKADEHAELQAQRFWLCGDCKLRNRQRKPYPTLDLGMADASGSRCTSEVSIGA